MISAMMQLPIHDSPIFLYSRHTTTQTHIMSLKRVSTLAARAAIASSRPARFQVSGLLQTTAKLQPTIQRPATHLVHQQRLHSTESKPDTKVWNFDSIKQLTESPDPSRVLIGTFPPFLLYHQSTHPTTNLSFPLLSQTSANQPNTPPATSPPPSTSPWARHQTRSSCPPTSSRISLDLRNQLQIRNWCFIVKLG